jgi:shikimate kinase
VNVVLTGFMGTGKSAAGRLLARELGLEFVDMDALIEKESGVAIHEIFDAHGEARFRELESGVIKRLTSGGFGDGLVVSTGGGAVVDPSNRDMLKGWGTVICLTATMDAIIERVGRSTHRPLLDGADSRGSMERLLRERAGAYADCHATIDTTGCDLKGVVERVIEQIEGRANVGD